MTPRSPRLRMSSTDGSRKKTSAPVSGPQTPPLLLGFEGGATHTVAIAGSPGTPNRFRRLEFGPGNFRLLGERGLTRLLRSLARVCPKPTAVAGGLAGVRDANDRAALSKAMKRVWPKARLWAGNDLETALATSPANGDRHTVRAKPSIETVRILVLSGTGSCCFGVGNHGERAKSGGWGHLLGDRGSGYALALDALRRVLKDWDHRSVWPALGAAFLHALGLNSPEQLPAWIQSAEKSAVASLAPVIFACARRGHGDARKALQRASDDLAEDAITCARKLCGGPSKSRLEFVFAGSILVRQPAFCRRVQRQISLAFPNAEFQTLRRESVWGAIALAAQLVDKTHPLDPTPTESVTRSTDGVHNASKHLLSPTEERNPHSINLDRLDLEAAVELMIREESRVPRALLKQTKALARLIRWVSEALGRGGRLCYVGAGTSGRLGFLDASECPPTFGTEPWQVQGIIAGGRRAIGEAVEGSEDDEAEGTAAMLGRGVSRKDVVIGIAASGRTPFVLAALREAKRLGARTALLTFNPRVRLSKMDRPHLLLAVHTGPEVLTGSTRLKAGTATKIALNTISTLAMARLGKISGNLMIDLRATNAKLRARAMRIFQELSGVSWAEAEEMLHRHQWRLKPALAQMGRDQRRSAAAG